MKLQVLPGQHFTCRSCTNCCRDWHVELLADETESIPKLAWPEGDPLRGASPLLRIGGRTFLAHKPGGACLFLDETSGLCRIHERFGAQAKPLGCRVFPFQIAATFEGEASVTGRYDCPTIRKNDGQPFEAQRGEIERYTAAMELGSGFDDLTRCALDRDQIAGITQFVGVLLNAFADDERRALFLIHFADWLSAQQVGELDRASLGAAFEELRDGVEREMNRSVVRPGAAHRLAFRSLLAMHLRRDEDVLNGRAGRVRRLIALTAFTAGGSSPRSLNLSQPHVRMRRVRLFDGKRRTAAPDTFAILWRLVRTRLESFQFMGGSNGGRNVIEGLRSLALLHPLSVAAARWHAAARKSDVIEPADAENGVALIEHAFGRSPLLQAPTARRLEATLVERETMARLIRTV
ncbi:MAG: YkgJ family cysteine cluster protein [Planctomycetes bacterium]|nr:YkgJ family cysteine cluster protein [Planctomycetota bacterium]